MTIAKTGNKILDGLARAKAKNDAAERAAKSKAKRGAGKGGKSAKAGKFKGAGKAGRAAARRSAKGILAKFNKKGSNAAGAAGYGLKDGADLIATNAGFDKESIAQGLSVKMRFDIKNQIVHMTFSTPASSGKASTNEWVKRVEFIRRELGVDDSYAYFVSRHNDAEHDHIHLFFNRVSDLGKVWKDNQIGLRLASLEQKIEKKFSLKLTKREDFLTVGNISKKTVERTTRLGVQPAFIQIQSAIIEAKKDRPDLMTYISRLADQGIAVRPNLQLGELNGLGYKLDGQSFTGKQLGANWAELKNEVIYDTGEHAETLTNLKRLVEEGVRRPERADKKLGGAGSPLHGVTKKVADAQRQPEKTNRVAKVGTEQEGNPDRQAGVAKDDASDSLRSPVDISGLGDVAVAPLSLAKPEAEPASASPSTIEALKLFVKMEKASQASVQKVEMCPMSFTQRREMNEFIKTLRYNLKRMGDAERTAPAESTSPRDANLDLPRF